MSGAGLFPMLPISATRFLSGRGNHPKEATPNPFPDFSPLDLAGQAVVIADQPDGRMPSATTTGRQRRQVDDLRGLCLSA